MIKECIAYEELFAARLEGDLTTAQKIALQNHVEECPSCHKEILEMKHHWDHVATLSFSRPGDPLSKPEKIYSRP